MTKSYRCFLGVVLCCIPGLSADDTHLRPPAFRLADHHSMALPHSGKVSPEAQAAFASAPIYFEKDPGAARFQTRAEGRGVVFEAGRIRVALGHMDSGVSLLFRGARSGI